MFEVTIGGKLLMSKSHIATFVLLSGPFSNNKYFPEQIEGIILF